MDSLFERLTHSVARNAETVQVQETAVDRYYLTTYTDGLDAYVVEYWDGRAVTIRRADAGMAMTQADAVPPWMVAR